MEEIRLALENGIDPNEYFDLEEPTRIPLEAREELRKAIEDKLRKKMSF